MKRKKQCNRKECSCNSKCSKVGDTCNKKNSNNSSTANFSKNKSTITDNEYEVTSESENISNRKKRS